MRVLFFALASNGATTLLQGPLSGHGARPRVAEALQLLSGSYTLLRKELLPMRHACVRVELMRTAQHGRHGFFSGDSGECDLRLCVCGCDQVCGATFNVGSGG